MKKNILNNYSKSEVFFGTLASKKSLKNKYLIIKSCRTSKFIIHFIKI